MPEDKDTLFGRLAVERGYVAQEQLDEAREAQERGAEAMGVRMPIAQILVSKGLLTKDQAQDLANAVAIQTGEASIVAGYEVVSKLGQGGMGAVYKARQVETGQYVALKILPPSLANEAMVKRFQREADVTSKLDHEHIVGCVEFGFDKRRKCHFCALEFVEGEDLGKRLKRTGAAPEGEAVAIALQIARALRHAHANGLVHRDVKPENIMITPAGASKLLDLGLARPANMEATRFTQSGMFVGSPYYASPEQALGSREIDTRADIYSLGATLYHMVTGTPPFAGATVMEILQKHVGEKVPWPADVNPELSDGVCRVIARMMAKDPAGRYQEPKELIRDLDALAAGHEPEIGLAPLDDSSVAPAARPRARQPRPAPRARREARAGRQGESMAPTPSGRAKVWIGLGAAAAACVVIAVILGTRGPERPPPARTAPRRKGTGSKPSVRKGARAGTDRGTWKATSPGAGRVTTGARKTPAPRDSARDGPRRDSSAKSASSKPDAPPPDAPSTRKAPASAAGDTPPASDWQTICDGTSLDFIAEWSRKYWRVRDGALALDLSRAGGDEGLLSIPRKFRDGAVSVRFSLTRPPVVPHIGLGVRFLDEKGTEPEKQYKAAVWGGSLTAGEHELRVTARGDTITATIDGKASKVTNEHSPREGRIQLVVVQTAESGFKIHSIRMREGAAVGPVDLTPVTTRKEPPSTPVEPLLVAFDSLIGKSDHAGARRYAEAEAAKRTNAPHAETLKAAARVAGELEAGRKAIRRAVEGQLGKEIELRTTKGKLAGKVEDVGDEAIILTIKKKSPGMGAIEIRMPVKWADLVPEQEDALARRGGWKPAGADGHLARAILALSRKDAAGARRALDAAGEHPLAAHYRAKVAAPRPVVGKRKPTSPAPTLMLDLGRGVTMEMIYIKPGVFVMGGTGNPEHDWQGVEKPKHQVAITRGFYMGRYEVTQAQYEAVTGGNPSKWKEPNRPVEHVTWHEAAAFCRLAADRTRRQVRLPTEAEWEYACRAGSTGRYCFGSNETGLGDYAWYKNISGGQTHPVGQKKANAWGLHDVYGNAWEWVADWYTADCYANSPRKDPTGPDTGDRRLLRGGSCLSFGNCCRSAFRYYNLPSRRYNYHGFRAAVSSAPHRATLTASQQAAYDGAMSRARIRIRLKNWKGAVEACEEALKAKPEDVEAKKLLAEAESHIGPAPTLTLDLGRGVTMQFVYIKPSVFMMGGTENPKRSWQGVEKPKHEVAITRGFYIGKHEVTQAQYEAVMGGNPSKWKEPNRPVEQVTWMDAAGFCRRASGKTRREVRLPTEAEWEYACRAGTTGQWCFGSDESRLGHYAWYGKNSGDQTHPVGQKEPNAWGLHDMHGNVWEWVADWYDAGYYARSSRENPTGPDAGNLRLLRGGSWHFSGNFCRSAFRHRHAPSDGYHDYGFRAVVSAASRGPSAKPGRTIALTRGLVGWWKFDEMRGTVARDSSGRGNHGSVKGGAKWTKGRIGGALDFDGVNDCVSVPRIAANVNSFTYAVWINMDSLPPEQRSIIHNVGWSHGDIHFAVDGHNQNRLQLGINGIWPEDYGLLSSHAFSAQDLGKWYHVAVVYDTVGKTWQTYVNGKLDGGRPLPKTVSVRIGPALIGGWDDNKRHIDAKLDDVRIYDRALSAAEVKTLAAGK